MTDKITAIDVTDDYRVSQIAVEINTIKRSAAQTVLQSAIEIGRLLCEAKDKLRHGEWGDWLSENVSYSVSNANNMMRLYKEFRRTDQVDMFGDNDPAIFEGMNMSQVLALLPLPPAQRREFIEQTGAKDLSSREITAEIKRREEAEQRAERAESDLAEATKLADALRTTLRTAEEEMEAVQAQTPSFSEEDKEEIERAAEKKHAEIAAKKIEAAKKAAEKKIAEAQKTSEAEAKKLREALEAERQKITEEAKKAAEEEIARRTFEAEAKARQAQIAASPHLMAFKLHMQALQESYRKMMGIVETAEAEDPPIGEKLRGMLGKIVESLSNQ